MPNPNVTTRHARNAIHLILSGAIRDIEAEFAVGQEDERKGAIIKLFDEVADEIDEWETEGSRATRMANMWDDMAALMASQPLYRDLLSEHDLLP
jgi:hypothetical protein